MREGDVKLYFLFLHDGAEWNGVWGGIPRREKAQEKNGVFSMIYDILLGSISGLGINKFVYNYIKVTYILVQYYTHCLESPSRHCKHG